MLRLLPETFQLPSSLLYFSALLLQNLDIRFNRKNISHIEKSISNLLTFINDSLVSQAEVGISLLMINLLLSLLFLKLGGNFIVYYLLECFPPPLEIYRPLLAIGVQKFTPTTSRGRPILPLLPHNFLRKIILYYLLRKIKLHPISLNHTFNYASLLTNFS